MFMPLYFPMGSPDPGTAEPGSTGEPATPGLPPDGSNPGTFEDDPALSGGESGDAGGDTGGGEWGQQSPPDEDTPFQPDDPASKDSGWGWGSGGDGSGSGGGSGGSSGGDGGGSWWDIFDE
jgi:hypothetical protein